MINFGYRDDEKEINIQGKNYKIGDEIYFYTYYGISKGEIEVIYNPKSQGKGKLHFRIKGRLRSAFISSVIDKNWTVEELLSKVVNGEIYPCS